MAMVVGAKPHCSSMTGIGVSHDEASSEGGQIRWELRSVNAKGLDIRLKVTHGFEGLETKLKRKIQDQFKRGSIYANCTIIRNENEANRVELDPEPLKAYLTLRRELEADAGPFAPIDFDHIALDGRFQKPRDKQSDLSERYEAAIFTSLERAIEAMAVSRASEGQKLQQMLLSIIAQIKQTLTAIIALSATATDVQHTRLKEQVAALMGDHTIDPQRLAQEVALLATKADVREETDRLEAHCQEADALLHSGKPIGRRLDFLSQEFSREANTLCAKAANNEITRLGLDLKTMIDQFREQTQNVE